MNRPLLMRCLWLALFIAQFMLPARSTAQAPANDECTGATVVSSLPFSTSQNTRLATQGASDPFISCNTDNNGNPALGGKSVWFTYTAAATQDISFSTLGSTPTNYDIMMGLFTGTCGALTQVACNDDAAGTRQSKIYYQVQAGTTYYVLIAEWNGGGPSGGVPTGGDLLFTVQVEGLPPLVRGPRSGSVPGGATVSTDGFPKVLSLAPPGEKVIPNRPDSPLLVPPKFALPPKGPEGSNYIQDRLLDPQAVINRPVVVKNFPGIPQTNLIPPDPIIAVGPNHVLAMVNSRFQIWDKGGNTLKGIDLNSWFAGVHPNAGFSDPQVLYDHFANRWVMAGIATDTSAILLSVSDDSNPLGVWYNWSLPGFKLGDSTTAPKNFSDYPQMGYDSLALYVTSREFTTDFQYCKVRIIAKSQLYANTAGSVTWNDIWDFRDPVDHGVAPDGLRPSIIFGNPGEQYLVNAPRYSPVTYITVWSLTNPISNPSITGVNVPVVQFQNPPEANQLGGSSTLINVEGHTIRHKAVYRDSSLWVVHPVASGPGNAYSALHYVRINPLTHANLEDVVMGLDGYWYYYPALMVDQNKNVFITYTRSGTSEYAGAYLSGRRDTDPPGLSPSVRLKAGEANYVKTGGGTRNRWGDYNGIAMDPVDPTSVWAFTEYAASPSSTWGTWIGQAKMGPLAGTYIDVDKTAINFPIREVGLPGDTVTVTITNTGGIDTLVISSITRSNAQYALVNPPTLPLKLPTYGSASFGVTFLHSSAGTFADTLVITSNALSGSPSRIALSGTAFAVTTAQAGVMYGGSGTFDSGRLLTIDPYSGAATPIGQSGFTQIASARVHPRTHEILSLIPSGVTSVLARTNSVGGDAHALSTIPISLLKGMDFRGDTLYVGRFTGEIYRVNVNTGDTALVAKTSPTVNIAGLAFHPKTGQLWASVRSGSPVDRIFKISLPSGAATLVGSTGLGQISDIIFDGNGRLFGISGTGSAINNLVRIDTSTGIGTVIGSMGRASVQALAVRPDSFLTAVPELSSKEIPVTYSLEQNYPNPFNPTTQIQYGLPQQSSIRLSVYNVLGQEIIRLFDGVQPAGFHTMLWDGTNGAGASVASGMYFYKLEAAGQGAHPFTSIKKMLLLK